MASQTYPAIEFICSDNNSTDGTLALLTNWCSGGIGRKLFTCYEKGLNKNFYNGMQQASGAYIIFCDQDDIWLDEKVEKLIRFHQQNPDASMVYCYRKDFQV